MTKKTSAVLILSRQYDYCDAEGPRARVVFGPAHTPRSIDMTPPPAAGAWNVRTGWQVLGIIVASEALFGVEVTRGIYETRACPNVECDSCWRNIAAWAGAEPLAPVRSYYRKGE